MSIAIFMTKKEKEKLTIELAKTIIKKDITIREAARLYGIPKSTLHGYIDRYLPKVNIRLWNKAKKVLEKHFNEKHRNGGMTYSMTHLENKVCETFRVNPFNLTYIKENKKVYLKARLPNKLTALVSLTKAQQEYILKKMSVYSI